MTQNPPRRSAKDAHVPVDGAIAPEGNAAIRSDEDIARRAYARYCERGCADGHDVEDWLEAERELRGS
jgi:hypothetical protein